VYMYYLQKVHIYYIYYMYVAHTYLKKMKKKLWAFSSAR